MSYSFVEKGALYSLDYRVYFVDKNGLHVSPFHDIPLHVDKSKNVFNMVVEVPRWTNAKMEISKEDKLNPIKQDIKKGKLRFVHNCFPYNGYIWNYGALPQTWEDPNVVDKGTLQKGDNDPIDVCEIGSRIKKRGEVIQVKVLGVLGLIDEGETDWKLIAIDVKDPLASKMNDIGDIDRTMPGLLNATHEWFKIYKVPTGKPENKFAFDGKFKDQKFALEVVEQANHHWLQLIKGESDKGKISCVNTTVDGCESKISADEAKAIVNANPGQSPPKDIPDEVGKWEFVKT